MDAERSHLLLRTPPRNRMVGGIFRLTATHAYASYDIVSHVDTDSFFAVLHCDCTALRHYFNLA